MTEETIFAAALDKSDPTERAAFLAEACGTDTALRQRVDALLAANSAAGDFLERPPVETPHPESAATRAYQPDDGPTRTHGDGPPADADDALSFLAPARMKDSLGRIGHYEVLEVLGRGGFGVVFRAFDEVLRRVVAVKVLAPQLAATSPARKRFLREAVSGAQVKHDNVVQIYGTGEEPLPYLVMEFIPGDTLQQRLDRTGPLDVAEVLRIGRQVAEGLAAAHAQDLIHRDIKPANVLIDGGPQQRVKLTDFGLARAADDASISQSGIVAGTPMYMAPEQARGEALDHRADLFSLGSVLYVMCSGRPPFRASGTFAVLKRVIEEDPRPIREIIPEVPEWLCRIVEKLHAKNPADRFQTAREVADMLADCEAQLKSHSTLRDYTRIPGGKARRTFGQKSSMALAMIMLAFVVGLGTLIAGGVLVTAWLLQPIATDRHALPPTEPATAPPQPSDGFTPLFNGIDLTGWKRHPQFTGTWSVENGVLVGRDGFSVLLSDREYEDFHLRAEVRATGGTGIYFRAAAPDAKYPTGWIFGLPDTSLYHDSPDSGKGWVMRQSSLVHSPLSRTKWSAIDIRAVGNQITIKVNEKTVVDYRIDQPAAKKGLLALHSHVQGEIQFRKIEIKELPATASVSDEQRLQGTWVPFEAESRGEKVPAERVGSITFVGDRVRVSVHDKPRGEGTFKIGTNATPKELDVIRNEDFKGMRGIYRLDGDVLTLAVDEPGPDRPNRFKTGPDTGSVLVAKFRKAAASDGFVPLFNGKDLTGWKVFPADRTSWKVENGVLVGSGKPSHLFTTRGDYGNFHLRMETRVKRVDKRGAFGVFVRTPFEDPGVILSPFGKGSLFRTVVPKLYDDKAPRPEPPPPTYREEAMGVWGVGRQGDKRPQTSVHAIPDDVWLTHEIIVDGQHLTIQCAVPPDVVSGSFKDSTFGALDATAKGHIALQLFDDWSVVEFRKIEIKELPAAAPTPKPADPAVVKPLQDLVAAKERVRDNAKKRAAAGLASVLDVTLAEIDLTEARVRLAKAEGNAANELAALTDLVAFRQRERDLVAVQVNAGVAAVDDLNRAEAGLADAKARLAEAQPAAPAPRLKP